MNGLAISAAAGRYRIEGDEYMAREMEAEYLDMVAQRDRARNLAATYEAELHHLESLHHQIRYAQKIQETKNA